MPVHLRPISRREFLARSLIGAAGLAAGPASFAASKSADKDSWALLSDIHLAADRNLVARGVNMTEHFLTASKELLALPRRPAGVFILGDCAYNSGESGDYGVVSDLLDTIRADRMPVHLALGNHDNRQRFWQAFAAEKAAKRPLADRQASLLRTPRANWFVLDSLEQTATTPGSLGPAQLDWLAQALDANKRKPAVVMVHHNLTADVGFGLKDTAAFLDVMRPRPQVKACIYGHTHTWKVEQDPSGIHLVNLPAVAYVFHPGDPSGWVHGRLGPEGMELELRCIDQTHKNHGQVVKLAWRA